MPEQLSVKEKSMGIIAILIGVAVLVFVVFNLTKKEEKYEIPQFMILSEDAKVVSEKEGAFAEFQLQELPTPDDLNGVKFEETVSYYRQQLPKNGWKIEVDRGAKSAKSHQFYARNSKNVGSLITIKSNLKQSFVVTNVLVQILPKYIPSLLTDDFEVIITEPSELEKRFFHPLPQQ